MTQPDIPRIQLQPPGVDQYGRPLPVQALGQQQYGQPAPQPPTTTVQHFHLGGSPPAHPQAGFPQGQLLGPGDRLGFAPAGYAQSETGNTPPPKPGMNTVAKVALHAVLWPAAFVVGWGAASLGFDSEYRDRMIAQGRNGNVLQMGMSVKDQLPLIGAGNAHDAKAEIKPAPWKAAQKVLQVTVTGSIHPHLRVSDLSGQDLESTYQVTFTQTAAVTVALSNPAKAVETRKDLEGEGTEYAIDRGALTYGLTDAVVKANEGEPQFSDLTIQGLTEEDITKVNETMTAFYKDTLYSQKSDRLALQLAARAIDERSADNPCFAAYKEATDLAVKNDLVAQAAQQQPPVTIKHDQFKITGDIPSLAEAYQTSNMLPTVEDILSEQLPAKHDLFLEFVNPEDPTDVSMISNLKCSVVAAPAAPAATSALGANK